MRLFWAFLVQVAKCNVAGTKLSFIATGDSGAAKDKLKDVLLSWLAELSSVGTHATKMLCQGNITTNGILLSLKGNGNQVQIINSELEKVINSMKKDKLQEADLVELMDGSPAFGKAIGVELRCVKPTA